MRATVFSDFESPRKIPMADVQPVRPTARSDGSAAQNLKTCEAAGPARPFQSTLGARCWGPAGAQLESEVALGVAQEDPPLERQVRGRRRR